MDAFPTTLYELTITLIYVLISLLCVNKIMRFYSNLNIEKVWEGFFREEITLLNSQNRLDDRMGTSFSTQFCWCWEFGSFICLLVKAGRYKRIALWIKAGEEKAVSAKRYFHSPVNQHCIYQKGKFVDPILSWHNSEMMSRKKQHYSALVY